MTTYKLKTAYQCPGCENIYFVDLTKLYEHIEDFHPHIIMTATTSPNLEDVFNQIKVDVTIPKNEKDSNG